MIAVIRGVSVHSVIEMPSGKTHDAITLLVAPAVFTVGLWFFGSYAFSGVVTAAFIFGGLMFGPDLDTHSRQYSRWGFIRSIWYPYRIVFKHRSRWSHGLVFGTLIRVVYLMGIVTLMLFAGVYAAASVTGGTTPHLFSFPVEWQTMGGLLRTELGSEFLPGVFAGMWAGAASHSLTDIAGTYIKTGRRGRSL